MTRRVIVASLLVVATFALAPGAGASGAPRCATSGLVVWLNTNGDGAAGSTFYQLEFTNLSGRTCTLAGYPGVSAVNLRGRRIGSAGARDPSPVVGTVTLAPGTTRTATLRIVQAGNFPASACHLTSAAGVRVFPPNQRTSKVIPFPFPACSRSGPVILRVRAVS